jgi:hypothetical protein
MTGTPYFTLQTGYPKRLYRGSHGAGWDKHYMLIVTNKMQHNTTFFIVVKAVHVSGGFPAPHQELKNCTCSIWYLLSLVAAPTSSISN